MLAWLAPRLNSCKRMPLSVSNTRISVPCIFDWQAFMLVAANLISAEKRKASM